MALADLFKTRRSNKIHQHVWQAIWEQVKTPPTGDVAAKESHLIFVSTLLYATRYQAALAAGIGETTARAAALQIVAQTNADEQLRDAVLSVFSADPTNPTAEYAATLNSLVGALTADAKSRGAMPQGQTADGVLAEIKNLTARLSDQLPAPG